MAKYEIPEAEVLVFAEQDIVCESSDHFFLSNDPWYSDIF